MPRRPNFTLASRPERREDFVGPEFGAGNQGHELSNDFILLDA
jgi:hypothetical protein